MTTRLTPAQRRALRLLATPGAEAILGRSSRWRVLVDRVEIGTIHAESLLPLRVAGLVELLGGRHALDWRQRLTEAGRSWLEKHPPPVLVAFEPCGCWAGSLATASPSVEAWTAIWQSASCRIETMPVEAARAVAPRCPAHTAPARGEE